MAGPQNSNSALVYPPMVYIDTVNGVPLNGSLVPTLIGTPTLPINNLADAILIAALRNTSSFHVKHVLTLDRDLPAPFNFFGDGDWYTSYIDLNFHAVDLCTFQRLGVVGSSPSYAVAIDCFVSGTTFDLSTAILNMDLMTCDVGSVQPVPVTGLINCYTCTAHGTYTWSLSGGGEIGVAGGQGNIILVDGDSPTSLLHLTATGIALIIMPSCAVGGAVVNSAFSVDDQSTGTFLVTDKSTYGQGKTDTLGIHCTSPANAGDVVIATASFGKVKIIDIVERSNGVPTVDMTTAAIYAGAGKVITLIDVARATRARLIAADMQEQGVGPWTLEVGGTVVITLPGTGPAPVDLTIDIEFEALEIAAHLE